MAKRKEFWWPTPGPDARGEWICPHRVGHGEHIHSCDGCCSRDDYPGKRGKKTLEENLASTPWRLKKGVGEDVPEEGGWHTNVLVVFRIGHEAGEGRRLIEERVNQALHHGTAMEALRESLASSRLSVSGFHVKDRGQ